MYPDAIFVYNEDLGLMQRVINKPRAYLVMALEEGEENGTFMMAAREKAFEDTLIQMLAAMLKNIQKDRKRKVHLVKFDSKAKFNETLEKLRSIGIRMEGQ